MKKGDRIRCKRACGELPEGAEGVCERPPTGGLTGLGTFGKNTYGISLEYFEVIAADENSATLQAVYSDSRSALTIQQGGDHYRTLKIQPIEYIHANNLGFMEGNVVKYVTRHQAKNGAADIRKIIHYCELILELQYGEKK